MLNVLGLRGGTLNAGRFANVLFVIGAALITATLVAAVWMEVTI